MKTNENLLSEIKEIILCSKYYEITSSVTKRKMIDMVCYQLLEELDTLDKKSNIK